MREMMLV